ncbi:hypothetical protein LguiA_033716 [Lonicera macranthoides]
MAPRKRKGVEEVEKTAPLRVTRSSTATANRVINNKQVDSVPAKAKPDLAKKKKARRSTSAVDAPAAKDEPPAQTKDGSKTIVIEHCKQCNQFKIRATMVKNALENDISGITVLVNPEKPRRGCFEIREEGGETFISLLDMKRPFAPMRALNMDEVISNISEKIK